MSLGLSLPPVPPRPYSVNANDRNRDIPPPIPPLPPNFRPDADDVQLPHLADPLVAPRPQRLNPDLPADMARTLNEQTAYNTAHRVTPQPGPPYAVNPAPGFIIPGTQPYMSPPPPPGAGFPSLPMAHFRPDGGMAGMSMAGGYQPSTIMPFRTASPEQVPQYAPGGPSSGPANSYTQGVRAPSASGPQPDFNSYTSSALPMPQFSTEPLSVGSSRAAPPPSPPRSSGPPSLTAPLPTVSSLQSALPSMQSPNADLSSKVAWIRDVLLLVNRASAAAQGTSASTGASAGTDLQTGPARIIDGALQRLADTAVPLLIAIVPAAPAPGQKLSPPAAEALYMRATLTAAGSFPSYIAQNQRAAFREFEAAARGGHHAAWFRLGRDYETFGDATHARECFERGAKVSDESCTYRLGMAHLLGQIGLPANPQQAIPLLSRAATLASVAAPQPAYVYALLLLDDFKSLATTLPPSVFAPYIPAGSSAPLEARRHLERAAYLHFAPAQYKLGHAYEFAEAPFPFDPLLSVQYYSFASQQGEAEADMALSKWFLCGAEGVAEGGFARDESLAFTFAEKAARKGLPSAEFAMGYYSEIGIGTPKDVQKAMVWYEKAAAHGSTDATQRITALSQSSTQALSRQEHDTLTENKLVRKRTQAKQRSDAVGGGAPRPNGLQRPDTKHVVEVIRRNSHAHGATAEHQGHPPLPASGQVYPQQAPSVPALSQHQQQQLQQQQPHPQYQQRPQQPPGAQPPQQQPHPAQPPTGGPAPAHFPERQRYSLSDGGSMSTGSPRMSSPKLQPTRPGRGGARIPSGTGAQTPPRGYGSPKPDAASLPPPNGPPAPPAVASPAPSAASGTKYNTFADMGIQGQKLEEKDCVIM
ncbi:hypothetical protein M0805_004555 [Coniferiporia weirii]|nr:hypothetical protein M0805_004555 [Coniferiporia weirii]